MLITWTPPLKSGKYKVRCRVSGREFDDIEFIYEPNSHYDAAIKEAVGNDYEITYDR